MIVYVIMGNDYPDSVFTSENKAKVYVKRKNAKDKKEFPHCRIFWRLYPFDLDGKAA
jgi:hypothetical protein